MKLNRSLWYYKAILPFFVLTLHVFYFKTESYLNCDFKTEIIKGFLAKVFDKLVIFAKTKETGKTQNSVWLIFS